LTSQIYLRLQRLTSKLGLLDNIVNAINDCWKKLSLEHPAACSIQLTIREHRDMRVKKTKTSQSKKTRLCSIIVHLCI